MEFGPTEITDKKGERFTLRSLQSCDTARLVRFQEQASRESEFLPWAPGGSNLMPDTAQYYIAQFADAEREMLLGIFAGDCKLVGLAELAGVGSGPYRWHRCTIAPGLLKRYWGRGLGTTLFTTMFEVARSVGYEQAEASVDMLNEQSYRLCRKMGYEDCGFLPHAEKRLNGTYRDYHRLVKMI
jgi:RimJ/RimL family protein N-acetyltransferase